MQSAVIKGKIQVSISIVYSNRRSVRGLENIYESLSALNDQTAGNPLDLLSNNLRDLQQALFLELAKNTAIRRDALDSKVFVGVLYQDTSTSAQVKWFPGDGSNLISVALGLLFKLDIAANILSFLVDEASAGSSDGTEVGGGYALRMAGGITRCIFLSHLLDAGIQVDIPSRAQSKLAIRRYSELFVVAHEMAHVYLGHDCGRRHIDHISDRLDEEEEADRLGLSLCIAHATRHSDSPTLPYIGALAAILVMGLEELSMIRPSITHTHPDVRSETIENVASSQLAADDLGGVEWFAETVFELTVFAGRISRPIPLDIWLHLVRDRRVEIAAHGRRWTRRRKTIEQLSEWDRLFSRSGIEEFITFTSTPDWQTIDTSGRIERAVIRAQEGDNALALNFLGLTQEQIETIVDTTQPLSLGGLVKKIESAPACGAITAEWVRHYVAIAMGRLLASNLTDHSQERAERWRLPNLRN